MTLLQDIDALQDAGENILQRTQASGITISLMNVAKGDIPEDFSPRGYFHNDGTRTYSRNQNLVEISIFCKDLEEQEKKFCCYCGKELGRETCLLCNPLAS